MGERMSDMWLYQMSEEMWPVSQFRLTVWEGASICWPTNSVRGHDRSDLRDRLLCWHARTKATMPGIVGNAGWFAERVGTWWGWR